MKFLKNEQVPLLDTYPYLIPKTYHLDKELSAATQKNIEWLLRDDNYKCSVQVYFVKQIRATNFSNLIN